jgi:hypothetical protein
VGFNRICSLFLYFSVISRFSTIHISSFIIRKKTNAILKISLNLKKLFLKDLNDLLGQAHGLSLTNIISARTDGQMTLIDQPSSHQHNSPVTSALIPGEVINRPQGWDHHQGCHLVGMHLKRVKISTQVWRRRVGWNPALSAVPGGRGSGVLWPWLSFHRVTFRGHCFPEMEVWAKHLPPSPLGCPVLRRGEGSEPTSRHSHGLANFLPCSRGVSQSRLCFLLGGQLPSPALS